MMFDRIAIKARAKQVLNLNLGHLIGAYALAVLLPALFSGGSSGSSSSTSTWMPLTAMHGPSRTDVIWPLLVVILIGIVSIALLFAFVFTLISFVGQLAYQRMSLMAYDGVDVRIGDLLGIKDYWAKLLGMYLWMALRVLLWSLLFIIPGIIAAYRYALAPYLMFEDPSKGINQVIDESAALMRGFKAELFIFDLSFIGWWLLCAVTFGVATLWVGPYYQIAHAGAYRAIRYLATARLSSASTPPVPAAADAPNPSVVTDMVSDSDITAATGVAHH